MESKWTQVLASSGCGEAEEPPQTEDHLQRNTSCDLPFQTELLKNSHGRCTFHPNRQHRHSQLPSLSALPGAPNPSSFPVSPAFHTPGHPQSTRARGVERGPETWRGFSAAGPSPPRSRPISRSKKAVAGVVSSLPSGEHHFQNIFTSLEHRK